MSKLNTLCGLMAGVSVLSLVPFAPVMAQTVVVVGAPEGQAPAAVGNTALTTNLSLGTNGKLIFNHTDPRYVVPTLNGSGTDLNLSGGTMDFVAGHTVLTQRAPIIEPSTSPPGVKATVYQPRAGGFATATVRNGAELEIEQYYTLNTRYQGSGADRISTVTQGTTFAGAMFNNVNLTVEKGGRLTGQGSISGSTAAHGFTIAGIISPHGFINHAQNSNEGPNGKFMFGSNSPSNVAVLRFTPTSVFEVDIDFTLPDGKLPNDQIVSYSNIVVEDGAQLHLRMKKAEGQTNYQVGRTFRILGHESPRYEQHYYQFQWANVPGVTRPAETTIYLDMAANPDVKTGDTIQREFDGQMYSFTYTGTQTNTPAFDLKGNFTLPDDGSAQLTRYLGLELQEGMASLNAFVTAPGSKEGKNQTVNVRAYIDLVIVQNRFFTEDANTINGTAAATALQKIGVHNAVYTRLMNLPVDSAAIPQLGQFFDSLSGDLHVGVRGLLTQDAYVMQRALSRRVSNYASGGGHLWAEALGGQRQFDASGEAPELKEDGYGLLAGIDTTLTGAWRVGIAGGYRKVEVDGPDAFTGKADVDQFYGSVYTSGAIGNWRAQAGAGISKASVETERSVVLVDVVDNFLGGTYDGTVANAYGELSYVHTLRGAEVEPFVGYNFVRAETDPLRETETRGREAQAALLISGDQTQVQFVTLGAKARTVSVGPIAFDGLLGWRRGFGDLELQGQHLMNNREYLVVNGSHLSENAAIVEVGARWKVTDKVTLDAVYDGVIGDEGQDHTARVGVSLRF